MLVSEVCEIFREIVVVSSIKLGVKCDEDEDLDEDQEDKEHMMNG